MNPYEKIPNTKAEATQSAKKVYDDISKAFPALVRQFETIWTAWQKKWFANPLSSSIEASTLTDEYDDLVALGPKIVPLVVSKLTSPANFAGIYLYNELDADKQYKVDPSDLLNYNVLNRQANLIVDMNFERTQVVKKLIADWQTHCRSNQVQSSSAAFTNGEAYFGLLGFYPSIVAYVMLAYRLDQKGFYYELLHEIVHGPGKKTGLKTIDFPRLYTAWSSWFENLEAWQVPRWDSGSPVTPKLAAAALPAPAAKQPAALKPPVIKR